MSPTHIDNDGFASYRLFNFLPDLAGGDQNHHDLDVALVKGGAHPCLHKLATTLPAPHPKVISLVDSKLKNVSRDMTRASTSRDVISH